MSDKCASVPTVRLDGAVQTMQTESRTSAIDGRMLGSRGTLQLDTALCSQRRDSAQIRVLPRKSRLQDFTPCIDGFDPSAWFRAPDLFSCGLTALTAATFYT